MGAKNTNFAFNFSPDNLKCMVLVHFQIIGNVSRVYKHFSFRLYWIRFCIGQIYITCSYQLGYNPSEKKERQNEGVSLLLWVRPNVKRSYFSNLY